MVKETIWTRCWAIDVWRAGGAAREVVYVVLFLRELEIVPRGLQGRWTRTQSETVYTVLVECDREPFAHRGFRTPSGEQRLELALWHPFRPVAKAAPDGIL